MFVKPRDREVVCHASAWDVTMNDDLRIKMCIKTTEEDLITIHHELGHNYYYHAYYKLPVLYQNGRQRRLPRGHRRRAHAVDHAAVSERAGPPAGGPQGRQGADQRADEGRAREDRVPAVRPADRQVALGRVRRQDQAGRLQQGLVGPAAAVPGRSTRPAPRTEEDFDPGAKYHIPANVPYTRYFLARMLQFQFHRALCRAAGHEGPLHQCSIYGNKEAGKKLWAMLQLGREQALAGGAGRLDRRAADRRHRDARLLRAARRLAQGKEHRPEVRLVTATANRRI